MPIVPAAVLLPLHAVRYRPQSHEARRNGYFDSRSRCRLRSSRSLGMNSDVLSSWFTSWQSRSRAAVWACKPSTDER